MQDLISTIFILFIIGGAIFRFAEWCGYMKKEGEEPKVGTGWYGHVFRIWLVVIVGIIIFVAYVYPRLFPP
jgi:hypothetical protein